MNPQERYDEIADDLAAQNAGVELGQMMGMPAIKAGKSLAEIKQSWSADLEKFKNRREQYLLYK